MGLQAHQNTAIFDAFFAVFHALFWRAPANQRANQAAVFSEASVVRAPRMLMAISPTCNMTNAQECD